MKRTSITSVLTTPLARPLRRCISALSLACVAALGVAQAAPFTAGNVVIYRIGTGAATGAGSLVGTGAPVFLDEYTAAGVLVQSVALPTTVSGAQKQLVASGTAGSEGMMSRSVDGRFMMLTGYASNIPGASSLSGTASATVNRVVGRVDAAGNVDTSTALSDYSTANNPRSVTSTNGTDIWVNGAAGGVRYTTLERRLLRSSARRWRICGRRAFSTGSSM